MVEFFFNVYKDKSTIDITLEIIVFFFGTISVLYAKKENILVYPTGLIATIITVYLLFKVKYFADMTLNIYFSVMSLYGWYNWSRKTGSRYIVPISRTNMKEKILGVGFFLFTILITYTIYHFFEHEMEVENYVDIMTSALFFTGMWYMAIKKIENWTLLIIGDIISIPLYAYRELWIISLQYIIFTILAVLAYIEWKRILDSGQQRL